MWDVAQHLEAAASLLKRLPDVHGDGLNAERYRAGGRQLRREVWGLYALALGMFDGTIEEKWDLYNTIRALLTEHGVSPSARVAIPWYTDEIVVVFDERDAATIDERALIAPLEAALHQKVVIVTAPAWSGPGEPL